MPAARVRHASHYNRTCDGIASHPISASCAQAIIRWQAKGDAVRMCEACLTLNRTCDGIASHPESASCAQAIIRWQAKEIPR
jgi:hypothetical protein